MNKKELVQQYIFLLEDMESYETPNGSTFVLEGETWYNHDKPSQILTTVRLAELCANEELEG